MNGTTINNLGAVKRVRYPGVRRCAKDGCETRLSQYNGSDRCWLHSPLKYPPNQVPGDERRRTSEGRVKQLPRAEHGTAGGHKQGCRCDPCRDAAAAAKRDWRRRRAGALA